MAAYENDEATLPESSAADAVLSLEALAAEGGAALSDRKGMPLISTNVDIPASPAIAADVLAGDLDGLDVRELPEDKKV